MTNFECLRPSLNLKIAYAGMSPNDRGCRWVAQDNTVAKYYWRCCLCCTLFKGPCVSRDSVRCRGRLAAISRRYEFYYILEITKIKHVDFRFEFNLRHFILIMTFMYWYSFCNKIKHKTIFHTIHRKCLSIFILRSVDYFDAFSGPQSSSTYV